MGHTAALLNDVRSQLAPDDVALKEARDRRDAVLDAAATFPGAMRTFKSGSLAHGTANWVASGTRALRRSSLRICWSSGSSGFVIPSSQVGRSGVNRAAMAVRSGLVCLRRNLVAE